MAAYNHVLSENPLRMAAAPLPDMDNRYPMKVVVVGLWHQGTVIAACLARAGHSVVGLDFDGEVIAALQHGRPPIFEPGLEDLVKACLKDGVLSFSADIVSSLAGADVVWIAYDTPVDADDQADVEYVVERVQRLFTGLPGGSLVLLSAQLPVGTTQRLCQNYRETFPAKPVSFAYSPENLRLGKAIDVFCKPDRVVVGVDSDRDRERVSELLRPYSQNIEWMGVESAEMTKHAINAFLAMSVTFINELAVICEAVGADAKEVERGLKSEQRIGPKAYLSPGGPFAGGTLARDIAFLTQIGASRLLPVHLLSSVRTSNDAHKLWVQRKLQTLLPKIRGQTVAVWGLTYKPGTDTLRRSAAVELCHWLVGQGARVQIHDPVVRSLPTELETLVVLCPAPLEAARNAHALVVATEWPLYRSVSAEAIAAVMAAPVVVDANRFLGSALGEDPRIRYVAVGKSHL